MNFKQIGLGLAATAAMTAGSMMAEAPAQAASLADNPLTGTLSLDLRNVTTSVASNFIDFGAVNSVASPGTTALAGSLFAGSTGSFTGITGGTITDLAIGASFPVGGITDFVTVTNGVNTVRFDLLELLSENLISNPAGPQGAYQALVRGTFSTGQGNDSTIDIFQARVTATLRDGTLELTPLAAPIPTPALLPGLVGMGLAALRKRKQEGVEQPEEVKA